MGGCISTGAAASPSQHAAKADVGDRIARAAKHGTLDLTGARLTTFPEEVYGLGRAAGGPTAGRAKADEGRGGSSSPSSSASSASPSLSFSPSSSTNNPVRQVDISNTQIQVLPDVQRLPKLTRLTANKAALRGVQPSLAGAPSLAVVSLIHNALGAGDVPTLPPAALKQLLLAHNPLRAVPAVLLCGNGTAPFARLEVLDLSGCGLRGGGGSGGGALPLSLLAVSVPALVELRLDDNELESLAASGDTPDGAAWGGVPSLQVLTARRNRLQASPSSLPEGLFARTRLASLELEGNAGLTAKAVLALPGFKRFEERRAAKLSKGIAGDVHGLQDFRLCGLD